MAWKEFVYETTIRETHLDTFGHVNNAQYLTLLEEARWEMITGSGYGLKEVHAKGQGPIILEVNLQFRKELRLREKIRIRNLVKDFEGKVGHMAQTIFDHKDEVACDALFTAGFFDLKARKLIPPTKEWLVAIGWQED